MRARCGLWVAVLVGLLSAPAVAKVVELEVVFEPPEVWTDDQGYAHVVQPDTLDLAQPGQPALPVRAIYVALPPGHHAVDVSVDPGQRVSLPGQHVVAPAQPPRPLSWNGPFPRVQPDPDIYQAAGPFPAEVARPAPLLSLRGFAILPVQLHPVVFQPASGQLAYSPWMRVTVTTAADKAAGDRVAFRGRQADFDRAARLVDNPEGLSAYPLLQAGTRNPDYRYVIVTNNAMAACSGANTLQTLTQDKEARGIPTRIETVESIRGSYSGADDAAKIRAFLTDMYENHGAEFVLLAGDADRSIESGETQAPLVPVRDLWGDIGSGVDQVPSDLYYAALDGTFDGNNNGVYGEPADQPDLAAELAVGRAAVDSCAEVANFVRKTLAYQNASGAYLNRVHMVGEFLWGDGTSDEDWGKGYMERIRTSSDANGFSTLGFSENPFFQVDSMYDRDLGGEESWHQAEILAVINAEPHIINHLGHSYTNYNMRLTSDEIISGMNNDQYFFEYTQGCYCGSFDNRLDDQMDKATYWQDSFVEHMTLDQAGAFAAIMNTRYGLGGYSNYFHRLFWDAMFRQGQERLGPMNNYSKDLLSGYVAADAGMRWVFYEATLFGDPEIALHTSASVTDPEIGLPAEAPWFLAIEGLDAPADQVITVRNNGGGSLNWTVTWDANWLTVSPAAGTAPTEVTLSADASGLAEGTHQATLTFTAPGATNSPQTMVVELYVIAVPSVVAAYNAAATPSVDGTITAGEYTGANQFDLGTFDGQAATARMLHDGGVLYMALEIASDSDVDEYDAVVIDIDADGDGLWPAAPANDGEYQLFSNGAQVFLPYFNAGSGIEIGSDETPLGVQQAFGMANGSRIIEVSIDLASSHLQRAMGEQFGLFLFIYDFLSGEDFDMVAMWPFAIQSWDDARYLGTVTVGTDTDSLMAEPASMFFQATRSGAATEPVNLTISSTTANALNFNLSPGAGWLHVSPTSGTTPAVVQVWADPAGQSVGPKSADLTVTSAQAANSPMPVPVTFQVDEAPAEIGVDPVYMSFEWTQGTAPPAARTFQVTNLGGGTLNWTADVSGGWVMLNTTSGQAPSTVTVTPVVQALEPGFHAGVILLNAPGAATVRVDLGIQVRIQPRIQAVPDVIEKYDPLAGGPVQVEFHVSNAEWGTMDWTATESANWISLEPTSGTYVTGHPSLITATLDPAGLTAGIHQADILVTSPDASNSPVTVSIEWTLEEGAALAVDPASLNFQADEGGANPASQTIQISNGGPGALDYSLDCQPAWLNCSPTSGSAPGSATISANISGLGVGLHAGTITITSAQALNSPLTVDVDLLINQGQVENQPPPAPELVSPADRSDIVDPNPELILKNVVDPDGHAVTYTFEIYPLGQGTPWMVIDNLPPGASNTIALVTKTLDVGASYEWRARAVDSQGLAGDWSESWIFNVVDSGTGSDGGGCGCASSGAGRPASLALLGLLLGLVALRRRR